MESRIQIEVKEEISQMQERDAMNSDAITTLSDQVAKLMHEIQILKQQK
jgi:hypothetical protein